MLGPNNRRAFQANETLALVYELNEFAQMAAEILNKSESQNETFALHRKLVNLISKSSINV